MPQQIGFQIIVIFEPHSGAVLASALQGSELRQLAVTSDGWSKVKTGDIVGYVKTEYVTTQHP